MCFMFWYLFAFFVCMRVFLYLIKGFVYLLVGYTDIHLLCCYTGDLALMAVVVVVVVAVMCWCCIAVVGSC